MEVRRTPQFVNWLNKLRDEEGKRRISARLNILELYGHFGVTRGVGGGVSEMKLDFGPGYRVYFTRRSGEVILLLFGGDKKTQASDILRARQLAQDL